jgi:predicted extracellular nuclease
MRSTLLILATSVATIASAQFSSGFENWTDTVPSDWMGVKSSISADSVEQVSTNVHGGTYAVRLTNTTTGHKRFTTQSVTVTDGAIYQISFWVRGNGEIRTGLFDGRSTGFGYAPYNAYTVSTGNTWTQVTQSITALNDTSGAEFILSVRSTSGPEQLVVDDVNVTSGGGPVNASVYGIQYTTDVNGNSPLNGQVVLTGGIVTGVDTIGQNSYFIQSGNGPWSGIYCFDPVNVVAIGDSVVLQATVSEFNSLTELTAVTSFTVVGQFATPTPQLLDTDGATQEQWEGVLAVIANATCTSLPDGFGEWTINQAPGSLPVDDQMYLYNPTVGTHYDVTGIVHYANEDRTPR